MPPIPKSRINLNDKSVDIELINTRGSPESIYAIKTSHAILTQMLIFS
ncbi:MAG: hypothetical protein M3Z80_05615 [Apibacter sp.]|nr:hypothetical protein [Apibacter sp.]MCT6869402.1 hypothetical protein [Apibacter sp.]